eukprot:4855176-Pyramimonas_sp.AAC.1
MLRKCARASAVSVMRTTPSKRELRHADGDLVDDAACGEKAPGWSVTHARRHTRRKVEPTRAWPLEDFADVDAHVRYEPIGRHDVTMTKQQKDCFGELRACVIIVMCLREQCIRWPRVSPALSVGQLPSTYTSVPGSSETCFDVCVPFVTNG